VITELVSRFEDLQQVLAQLSEHLTQTQPAHWLPLQDSEIALGLKPLSLATDLLTDLWYRDQQDGRETRSRHGLILADTRCRTLITDINQAKDDFRAAVQLEKQDLPRWKESYRLLGEHPSSLRNKLAIAGMTRVHLKQCFRHIPLLAQAPRKVGFSWYVNGRSIKKLTLSQAEALLLELGEHKPHIQIQLQRLGQLPPATRLAQIQTLAPVVRANLVYNNGDEVIRKAMSVSLPLFIPDTQPTLPEHNRISSEPPPGRTRQARGDQRISDEPFLPSIRAYLYH
jgi:hypothetical protein